MAKRLRAAIVGLGQVGMLFDSDQRRSGVWTHFSAYERLADFYDLVAAVEPDAGRLALARQRRPELTGHARLGELLDAGEVDVVSLCTPPELHAAQIAACAGRVQAVICEKPLAADSASARVAVDACRAAGTVLAVNYYKRFDGLVPAVKRIIDDGQLGRIKLASATFCGPLDAVGSHMADLLRFLIGEMTVQGPALVVEDRWSVALRSEADAIVQLCNAGPREEFIFELDVLGDEGRVRLLNNCSDAELFRYRESDRYSGYRELFPGKLETGEPSERFLPLFLQVAETLHGERAGLVSDGGNALRTQLLIDAIAATLS